MFAFSSLGYKYRIGYKCRISSNKRQTSNNRRPLISTAPLSIHIEISASPLKSAASKNAAFIRIVTIFH